MSKITRHLATAAATLTVAGGMLLGTGGAASAATSTADGGARDHVTQISPVWHENKGVRWDGHRWWHRYTKHGDWYSTDHGRRYRFDGHRFYRWDDGRWKRLSSAYARHHGFDRRDFPRNGHGHDGHHGHGR